MLYILDTADLEAIKHCNEYYPLAGVTTNPSIIAKENTDFWVLVKEIRKIIGDDKMLHIQTTQDTAEKIVEEAKLLKYELGGEFYVKIPISEEGLKATKMLKKEGIGVTMTAIFTPPQALVAAKAGAAFVAPYANRLDNIIGDGCEVVAQIVEEKTKREVVVTNQETGESVTYLIPYGSRIKVREDQVIAAGDELTEGSVNPHDILAIKGYTAVQDYLIQEVQRVYRLQGVDINDKHIEVIVRQMMHKVKVEDAGDTDFLTGSLVERYELERVNNQMRAEGKAEAVHAEVLMGITKAALATDSFLSAASFQETTRVLTDAAIKGKVDPLVGLKENVIIGKLIPAGTGMKCEEINPSTFDDDEVVEEIPQDEVVYTTAE